MGSRAAAAHQTATREPLDPAGWALLTLGPLLLLLRHRFRRTVALGTALTATGYLGAGYPYGPVLVSVAVACFGAVVAGRRYAAWGALAVLWAGHVLCTHVLYGQLPPRGDGPPSWNAELVVAAVLVALLTAAELARTRRHEWLRRRREEAEAERRRANEERLRIARELHDVLAHSMSVINVQAGVGLALLDSDREQARSALTTIKTASKEALGDVRQVLDTLRAPGDAPRAPAPGLDRLPELTEQAYGAGLEVRTETVGEPVPLPAGSDLAAFRIVQEALTNVVRHSGARTAGVRLRYGQGELEVRIEDEGPAAQHDTGATGGGKGLTGMRERAAALGGSVSAGPHGDGGFRVTARLPLASGEPAAYAEEPEHAEEPAVAQDAAADAGKFEDEKGAP